MAAVMNEDTFRKFEEDHIYENFKSLEDLYENQLFCDLTLVSKDGMEFKVHKSVVYSASGYFKGLYESNMKESVADRINLDFVSGHILRLIISFMYEAEIKTDKAEEIVRLAEKSNYLQIDQLRDMCLVILQNKIDDSNCLNLWRLAKTVSSKEFGETCLAYIFKFVEKLLEDSTFLNDLSVDEIKQLLLDSRLPFSQEYVVKYALRWARDDFEMFIKVIGCIDCIFPLLSKEFIMSNILTSKLLMQEKKLMEKIIQYATSEWTVETEKDEPFSSHLSLHNAFLAVLDSNVLRISSDGEILDSRFNINFLKRHLGYAMFHDNLFTCGGQYKSTRLKTCEYYSLKTGKFTSYPPLETARSSHECYSIDDQMYVCGGCELGESVEIFNLRTGKSTKGPSMTSPRYCFGLTSVNKSLYAIGGLKSRSIEFLDPRSSNGWTTINNSGFYSFFFINDNFTACEITQCVSIGPEIYCFRRDHIYIFDTRVNKLRRVNYGYNAVVKNGCFDFKVCELDGDFGVILPYKDSIKFFKYNTKGDVLFEKELAKLTSDYSVCLSTYYNND